MTAPTGDPWRTMCAAAGGTSGGGPMTSPTGGFRGARCAPLQEVLRRTGLSPDRALVIDDLKPGYDMAMACGVPFAAAGWANDIPEIETFMRRFSRLYFKTVSALADYLFDEEDSL